MSTREGVVLAAVRASLIAAGYVDVGEAQWDGTLPRNCPGVFWRNNTGTLRDRTGRPVSYGCVGSSDLLVVKQGGQLVAIECKRPVGGRASKEQINWGRAVASLGGRWILATSAAEVMEAL